MAKQKIDISGLSQEDRNILLKEIQHLADVEATIEKIGNDLEQKAEEVGVSYAYLLDHLKGQAKPNGKTKAEPAYRDPENPELTWSGRGKRPAWFKARLEEGLPVDYLRI